MKSSNPFYIRELPLTAPFCDREEDMDKLLSYAEAKASVVLYSPRRFGKTSLIKRVQNRLSKEGGITVFCDFFGAGSIDDIAARIAHSVYAVTHAHESIFKKAVQLFRSFRPTLKPQQDGSVSIGVEPASRNVHGIDLLQETMESLKAFHGGLDVSLNVTLDEFQEITELQDAPRIEGVLRQTIQQMPCSFFFVGSRRRTLLGMFNERSRPFYQSSVLHELKCIASVYFVPFIQKLFEEHEVVCAKEVAAHIVAVTQGHPYYTQKLCFFLYERSIPSPRRKDVDDAFEELLENETPVFEAILQGLASRQISLLRALAAEPTDSPYSLDYMVRHNLGSTGAIQGALNKLTELDLIEKKNDQVHGLVDPVFKRWLEK